MAQTNFLPVSLLMSSFVERKMNVSKIALPKRENMVALTNLMCLLLVRSIVDRQVTKSNVFHRPDSNLDHNLTLFCDC